jgi:guanylate kinase
MHTLSQDSNWKSIGVVTPAPFSLGTARPLATLTGPSGGGKTFLVNELIKRPWAAQLTSTTTRPPRPGEVNGVDYHFISMGEFEASEAKGEFLQKVEFKGNKYGTRLCDLRDIYAQGKVPFCVVEPTGITQFEVATARLGVKVLPIYVDAELGLLLQRYLSRLVGRVMTTEETAYHQVRMGDIANEKQQWGEMADGRGKWLHRIENNGTIDELYKNCDVIESKLRAFVLDANSPDDASPCSSEPCAPASNQPNHP